MAKKAQRQVRKQAAARVSTKARSAKGSAQPKQFSVAVFDQAGKPVGDVTMNEKVFTGAVNRKVLYQAVNYYNANKRQGNASTKTRGDVSGGGKKPWRQKGTGRARAGSSRSPLWRGGGVIFGPHPRDYHKDLPKKVRKAALLSSLNNKLIEENVKGVQSLHIEEAKTKKVRAILAALKLSGKTLMVVEKPDALFRRASNNLREVTVRTLRDFSTMDVLRCDTMVVEKTALEKLHERCV